MKIVIETNLKPRVYKERTKSEVLSKIFNSFRSSSFGCSSKLGTGILIQNNSGNDDIIRVYNLEKHRTKKTQSKTATFKSDKGVTRKTKINKKAQWVAYAYDFSETLLKSMNVTVEQRGRTFTFIDKDKKKMSVSQFLAVQNK